MQKWTQGVGAEVSRLGAMDHGAEAPGATDPGAELGATDHGAELGAVDPGVDPLNTTRPRLAFLCSRGSLPHRRRSLRAAAARRAPLPSPARRVPRPSPYSARVPRPGPRCCSLRPRRAGRPRRRARVVPGLGGGQRGASCRGWCCRGPCCPSPALRPAAARAEVVPHFPGRWAWAARAAVRAAVGGRAAVPHPKQGLSLLPTSTPKFQVFFKFSFRSWHCFYNLGCF